MPIQKSGTFSLCTTRHDSARLAYIGNAYIAQLFDLNNLYLSTQLRHEPMTISSPSKERKTYAFTDHPDLEAQVEQLRVLVGGRSVAEVIRDLVRREVAEKLSAELSR